MKTGDYVRTENGEIGTIIDCPEQLKKDYGKWLWFETTEEQRPIRREQIDKSSPNIIELFEEHDLVVIEYYSLRYNERVTRLFEVDYKDKEFMTIKNAHCDFMLRNNEFNDEDKKLKPIIKSIVTKEQFESMEYKVGE